MINSKNTLMYVFISKNPSNYTWCCIKCNSTFFICLLWQTQDLGVGKFFLLFYWRKESFHMLLISYYLHILLVWFVLFTLFFFWQKLSLPTIFRTVAELMLMLSFSLSIWIRDNQTPWLQICFFKNKCKKWERKEKKKKRNPVWSQHNNTSALSFRDKTGAWLESRAMSCPSFQPGTS